MPSPFASLGLTVTCVAVLIASAVHAEEGAPPKLERIRVAPDGKSFILAESGQAFRVWGVNYDHDSTGENGRLLEDYWAAEWEKVRRDFHDIKALGANVVRIHLQFAKFMDGPETPNPRSLAQLQKLVLLAGEVGLYLDLTGLGCYHKADTPAWYDALDENGRWNAQAHFWTAIAEIGRPSSAVFCYDLMNEPIIDGRTDNGWLAGDLKGYSYVQRLTLTPGKRTNIEIARAWVTRLTTAIRATDPDHLLTVGDIPWAMTWPGAKPIFYAPEVRDALDFVSIHVYPKKGEIDKALAAIGGYEIGKPVLIEETFPIESGLAEMDDLLRRSKPLTSGYVSFYWGQPSAEYTGLSHHEEFLSIVGGWLKYFHDHADFMKQP